MEQQSTSDTATRDNIVQLLNILKQRSLGNKIDDVEASRLINDIISSSEDDTAKLRRSKRGLMKEVKKGYRWLRKSIQRLNTQENRELLIKEGPPLLHKSVHQPDTSEDWVEKILDFLDAFDPFRDLGKSLDYYFERDEESLCLAAKQGRLDGVKYLIEYGVNVNARGDNGYTPLHAAAYGGHLDVIKYLVEKGADVNARNTEGETALIIAFNTQDYYCDRRLDMMKYLIDKGADVNARNEQDRSVLCLAAGDRRWNDFDFLIENGADINAKSRCGGNTLLHFAIMGNQYWCHRCIYPSPSSLNTIKYLVERGANVNVEDNDGKTPLDIARSRGNSQVVEFLSSYQHGNRDRRDVVSGNSWTNNSIVNWVKGLASSTESPALLTSTGHDNTTVTAIPEINTTVVNNTLMLGILATSLFNKTQHRQPIHENLLSPREQSMRRIDMDMIMRAIQQGEEKFGDPDTKMDEVKISGNKTGMWKRK